MSKEDCLPNHWVNKEIANLDLKLYISYTEPDTKAGHTRYGSLCSRKSRAGYYRMINSDKTELKTCTDQTVSEYFLGAYRGEFRRKYLSETFPGVKGYSLAWYVNVIECSL